MQITIYHNPACGTSRNALEMIRAAAYAPTVVEYLKTGWTRDLLKSLMTAAGATPRDWLRAKGTPADELGLLADFVTDDALTDAMVAHPVLVNRPIVVTPKGTALCRPSEGVLELMDHKLESFTKEDGEVICLR